MRWRVDVAEEAAAEVVVEAADEVWVAGEVWAEAGEAWEAARRRR